MRWYHWLILWLIRGSELYHISGVKTPIISPAGTFELEQTALTWNLVQYQWPMVGFEMTFSVVRFTVRANPRDHWRLMSGGRANIHILMFYVFNSFEVHCSQGLWIRIPPPPHLSIFRGLWIQIIDRSKCGRFFLKIVNSISSFHFALRSTIEDWRFAINDLRLITIAVPWRFWIRDLGELVTSTLYDLRSMICDWRFCQFSIDVFGLGNFWLMIAIDKDDWSSNDDFWIYHWAIM